MDKDTLSNYGWIVICVMILAVLLALASPFGTFIANAVKATTEGLFMTNQNALGAAGITIPGQNIESLPCQLMDGPSFNATIPESATSVAFCKEVAPEGVETIDVSANQDGTVVAWLEGTTYKVSSQDSRKTILANSDASYLFSMKKNLTAVDFANLNTSKSTTMKGMFYGSTGFKTLDVSSLNTSNVTDMSYMFGSDTTTKPMSLTSINFGNNFVTNKATDLSYMFYYNNYLTALNIDDWDVSNVVNMSNMFMSCQTLTTFGPKALADWDTGNVVYMDHAFRWLKKLEAFNLEQWDVSSVKTFSYAFCNGAWTTVLDLEAWDTSNCEDMSMMFHSFKTLTTLKVNTWDVRNVKTFDHFVAQMGSNFKNMDVSNWQVTNKCENLNGIFHSYKGTTIDVSGWDTSNVKVFTQMFDGCTNLTEIIGLQDLDTSSGKDFMQMFQTNKIKHLDLSFIDTRNATPDYSLSKNGSHGLGVGEMMYGNWNNLEKITVSANLSHDGDGSCIDGVEIHHDRVDDVEIHNCGFVFPKSKTGYWYNIETGKRYLNTEIPDDTAATYVRDASMLPEGVIPN